MKIVMLLMVFMISFSVKAEKCAVFIERPEYAESQFFDLNIEDEYVLSKEPEKISQDTLARVKKLIPKMRFGEKELNLAIVKHFFKQTELNAYLIKNLDNQTRKVYLVKYDLDKTHYYSFLLYLGCVND